MSSNGPDERFAIYYIPDAASRLYRFGAAVLGYDCRTGQAIDFPPGAPSAWANAVRAPQVYGFHATLKPPFRLRGGRTRGELESALDDFAAAHRTIDLGRVEVASLGPFVALTPAALSLELNDFAAACVRDFDGFRASMPEDERSRRLVPGLTPRQKMHLDRWGYPYVLDDFRFHMTLSGPLAEPDLTQALGWLRRDFASLPEAHRVVLDRIVLVRQSDGPFLSIRESLLRG